jgi:pantoate--beta-alanine ligase
MQTIQSVPAMQRLALRWKRSGLRIGFVPTMGYLHDGHISLVAEARQRVGKRGKVVVSIYVNPTQFAPTEDLAKYPRDFRGDSRRCKEAGVDAIFYPSDAEMYPGKAEGLYSTYVVEERLTQGMEGASRPTHFRGVTTVVAKLFNCVLPDVAVFGAKDWQQAAVVQRMVRDLNFPLEMIVAPTRREADGLAMSSRNAYLNPLQREQGLVLARSIQMAGEAVKTAKRSIPVGRLKKKVEALVGKCSEARLDYVEFFSPDSLEPVLHVRSGDHMAMAVFFGKTRLIDNGRL